MTKKILLLIFFFIALWLGSEAQVAQISAGETGSSVRGKLNNLITHRNLFTNVGVTNDSFIVGDGVDYASKTPTEVFTILGISTSPNMATFLANSTFADIRTDLGLVVGTDVQAYDADLTTLGAGGASARSFLGLTIGSDVQAYDADLTTYAGITPSANVQTMLGSSNNNGIRSNIGLGTSSTPTFLGLNLTSDMDMGGNTITNMVNPSIGSDGATKDYVDTEIGGVDLEAVLTLDNSANSLGIVSAGNISPSGNGVTDFGGASNYWNDGYIEQVYVNDITGTGEIDVLQDLDLQGTEQLLNASFISVDQLQLNNALVYATTSDLEIGTLASNNNVIINPDGTGDIDMSAANVINAADYNGVALTTAGSATNFLNEQGNYVAVSSGTDDQTLSFDGTDLTIESGNSVDLTTLDLNLASVLSNGNNAGSRIINVTDPINAQDAATKNYVDLNSTDDQNASEVANTPSGNLIATDVQAALNELQTEIDAITVSSGVDESPTVGGTNISLTFSTYSYYIRSGNYVKVDVHSSVRTSATGATTMTITLPVATSNFVNDYDAAGVITTSTGVAGTIEATVAAQTITASFDSDTTSDQEVRLSFTYEIQ